jgi:hypothetical protein
MKWYSSIDWIQILIYNFCLLQGEEDENSMKTTKNLFGFFSARPNQVVTPHCTCSEYEKVARSISVLITKMCVI